MEFGMNLIGKRVKITFLDPTGIVTPSKWKNALVTNYTGVLDDDDGENIEVRLDGDPSIYGVYKKEIKSIEIVD